MGSIELNVVNFPQSRVACIKQINEYDLQNLWYDGFLIGRKLRTDLNSELIFKSRGDWNSGAGPDFRNCRIILRGEEISGDLEIHKNSADWYRHRHHTNPEYDNVAAHLTLESDAGEKIRNSRGMMVPQVTVADILSDAELKLLADYSTGDVAFSPYKATPRCRFDFNSIDTEDFSQYLYALGRERIISKTERIGRRISEVGYEQALYEGLFESAGYSRNKYPFLFLAGNLSLRRLRSILQWIDPRERSLAAEALLLGCGRLIPYGGSDSLDDVDIEGSFRIREIEKIWRRLRHMAGDCLITYGSIQLSGGRPQNSPLRTLSGLAIFLTTNFNQNLFRSLKEIVLNNPDQTSRMTDAMGKYLNPEVAGFWVNRYNFKKVNNVRTKIFGQNRINRFTGNILIPVLLNYSREKNDKKTEKKIINIAKNLKAAPNRYTRFVCNNLPRKFLSEFKLTFLIEQGLINHYKRNCSKGKCHHCRLKYDLKKIYPDKTTNKS